jgi:hypothetical protein
MAELNTGSSVPFSMSDFQRENFLKSMTLSKFHSKTEKNLW